MMRPSVLSPRRLAALAPSPARRWPIWQKVTLIVLLCGGVGLLEAVQVYSGNAVRGQPIAFARALSAVLPFWFTLAALIPGVLWLASRFRLDGVDRGRGLAAHAGGSLVFAALHVATASWLSDYVFYDDFPLSFGANLWRLLSLHLVTEVIFYWALVGGYYAVDYYGRYRERERDAARLELEASRLEAGLAQANLQALRMQLHPHFLFNTLNAVSTLALKGDRQRVVRMLNRLSDLLRLTLDTTEQVLPLRRELEILERYLDIEQVRFGERLIVRMDVAPEALDALVPTLLLQPVVENAVRHGVARQAGPGRVDIAARPRGGRLEIEITDTGPGFPPGAADGEAGREPRGNSRGAGGVGLSNVRARLEQLYPGQHRLELGDAPGGGARVVVAIPLRHAGRAIGAEEPALERPA